VCRASSNLTSVSSIGEAPPFDNKNTVDYVITNYNLGPESQEAADKGAKGIGAEY
jgi:hypothetical protein